MKSKKNFKRLIGSLILAIVVFISLILVQSTILHPNGEEDVFISKDEIAKNTLIDKDNVDKLFKSKKVDGELKVTNAVVNKDELIGKIILENIPKGSVVSSEKMRSKESVLNNIENPVECSISVSSISQSVGGTIREGDMVNISVVNEMSKKVTYSYEGGYVNKVFTADGKQIKKTDDSTAVTLNIILSKEEERKLNEAIVQGTIRVSKN